VDAQFPKLTKSEKFQIFRVIAPILSEMMLTPPELKDEEY
jgi:hypothetical protein